MRNLFTPLKALRLWKALSLAAAFALLASGPATQAANPLELNFGLFGPRYDGRVKELQAADKK